MTYIEQRNNRFYVVAYDGLDPLTGKERRRWHPVGHDRHDAELLAARIAARGTGHSASRRDRRFVRSRGYQAKFPSTTLTKPAPEG